VTDGCGDLTQAIASESALSRTATWRSAGFSTALSSTSPEPCLCALQPEFPLPSFWLSNPGSAEFRPPAGHRVSPPAVLVAKCSGCGYGTQPPDAAAGTRRPGVAVECFAKSLPPVWD